MHIELDAEEFAVLRQILFARDFALPVLLARPVARLQDKLDSLSKVDDNG